MKQANEDVEDLNLPFKSGDLFFTFDPTLIGQIKKVIFRRSFTGVYLYLDLNGHGVIIGNFDEKFHQVSLREFNKKEYHLTPFPIGFGPRIMKKVLPLLGSETNMSEFISKFLHLKKASTPDELYDLLKIN